jgi:hypothetical protein
MPIGPQKRSNAGKPRKRPHPARPKSRFEEAIDRVAGGKQPNRSRRCVRSREAMRSRCVFGKPKLPRATARRDRFAGRWFGGGRRTRSSSGTRPNTPVSMQLESVRRHTIRQFTAPFICHLFDRNMLSTNNFHPYLKGKFHQNSYEPGFGASLRASAAVASASRNLRSSRARAEMADDRW